LSLSILPSQCRAARALIEMDHAELARRPSFRATSSPTSRTKARGRPASP
jgi:hypothetical protein